MTPAQKSLALSAAFMVLVAGQALAGEGEWRAACTHDALAHCTGQAFRRDRAGVKQCLVAKIDRISGACRTVIIAALADSATYSPVADKTHRKDP
jgi:hypothetical protein